jgi:hypothetical protein
VNYTTVLRRRHKWQAIVLRGGPRLARCDLTGKMIGDKGDYHELIPRSMTVKNPEARMLSYRPELCAYLSTEAHRDFHDNEPSESARNKMLQKIYEVFAVQEGSIEDAYERVKTVFDELQDVLVVPVPFDIPEPEEVVRE